MVKKKWQLPFNSLKGKVMYFGKKNPKNYFVLYDRVQDTVTQEKDLGVLVSRTYRSSCKKGKLSIRAY